MNCLEKYRSELIRDINRELRIILQHPDSDAVHNFRVGIKRLTAIYYFLNEINPSLKAKKILKPCRSLFKPVGKIRDGHIAIQLIEALDELDPRDRNKLIRALSARTERDNREFQRQVAANPPGSIRMPTISATGVSERAILRHKPIMQTDLLQQVFATDGRMNAVKWHKKRILLKRYQHLLDAFHFCPGHLSDEDELKQIKLLTQLLGDWHDRVITTEQLRALPGASAGVDKAIRIMQRQDRLLLGSARIYLGKFVRWHRQR